MPSLPLHLLLASAAATAATGQAELVTPNTDKEICNAPSLKEIVGVAANQTCIEYDGLTRCWYTHVPQSLRESAASADFSPVPLVLDLHGYNLCAAESANYTGWARIADENGFVVVYPQGNLNAAATNDPCWSFGDCCCWIGVPEEEGGRPPPADLDDVGFLHQVVSNVVNSMASGLQDDAHESIAIDTKRIYFAGHSAGCMMAQAMAALRSDLTAAVCCHASSLRVSPSGDYTPTPVQVVYGDLDTTIAFFFGSINHILNTWGPINGCTGNSSVVDESGLFETHTLTNCTGGATIETVEVYNVGHFSYLGVPPDTPMSIMQYPGAITPTVDTTKISWEFCSRFSSDETPDLLTPVGTVAPYSFVGWKEGDLVDDVTKDAEETNAEQERLDRKNADLSMARQVERMSPLRTIAGPVGLATAAIFLLFVTWKQCRCKRHLYSTI